MKVIKRDGTTVDFDGSKIVVAIQKANAVVDPQDRIEEYKIGHSSIPVTISISAISGESPQYSGSSSNVFP